MFLPSLNLVRNDYHFPDGNEKEGPSSKLVYCFEGLVLTVCQALCYRVLYCYSPISSQLFFTLFFDPDTQSLNDILLRTRFVRAQNYKLGCKTNKIISALCDSPLEDKHVKNRPPKPTLEQGRMVWMCFLLSFCLCEPLSVVFCFSDNISSS